MTFKDDLLDALDNEFDINPTSIARGLAKAIKGETIKERFDCEGGSQILKQRVVVTTPRDVMQGAMLYDALRGGDMGIAPREFRKVGAKGADILHERISVDRRIIANENNSLDRVVSDEAPVVIDINMEDDEDYDISHLMGSFD